MTQITLALFAVLVFNVLTALLDAPVLLIGAILAILVAIVISSKGVTRKNNRQVNLVRYDFDRSSARVEVLRNLVKTLFVQRQTLCA